MKKNSRQVVNNKATIIDRLVQLRPELRGATLRPKQLIEHERQRILTRADKLKY